MIQNRKPDADTVRFRITAILDQRILDNSRKSGIRYVDSRKELRDKGVCTSISMLARKAGIDPSNLTKAINGRIPFYPEWRKRIADALDVAEEEIFGEEDA